MDDQKIFDEWKVDCNECERWWLNQCDGVKKGINSPCKSFLATRNVVIPQQIKALQKRIFWLTVADVLLGITAVCLWVWR